MFILGVWIINGGGGGGGSRCGGRGGGVGGGGREDVFLSINIKVDMVVHDEEA